VRWPGLWIGIAGAAIAGGFAAKWAAQLYFAELTPRALPGFDVSIPSGEYTKDDGGKDYARGRVIVYRVAEVNASLVVKWEPGWLSDDDRVAFENKMKGVMHGGKPRPLALSTPVTIPGAERTHSWATRAGRMTAWTTEISCGARRVGLVTTSSHFGVERLHRRIAATFRCHPDAAMERTVGVGPTAEPEPPASE
jgi:hypothetical protein